MNPFRWKRLLTIICATFILIFVTSKKTYLLSVDKNELEFVASDSQSQNVAIESNCDWSILSDSGWCKTSISNGKGNSSFSVSVEQNGTVLMRKASIIVTSKQESDLRCTIEVRQLPVASFLKLSVSQILFASSDQSSSKVSVESNAEWSVESNSDWCTASPNGGSNNGNILVNVTANKSVEKRTAILTVKAGPEYNSSTGSITVVQAGTQLEDLGSDNNNW
jgi:hypothetical protein